MSGAPENRRAMRPYLSFPRGARIPSPRILFYASDDEAMVRRALSLSRALTEEFATGSVVLVTGAVAEPIPRDARVEIVRLPGMAKRNATRPLARERARHLRQRLLSTLFDVFQPDLLLLEMLGPEAEHEAHLLLQRARIFGAATLIGVGHDAPDQACSSARESTRDVCEPCRHRTCSSAREALSPPERRRAVP